MSGFGIDSGRRDTHQRTMGRKVLARRLSSSAHLETLRLVRMTWNDIVALEDGQDVAPITEFLSAASLQSGRMDEDGTRDRYRAAGFFTDPLRSCNVSTSGSGVRSGSGSVRVRGHFSPPLSVSLIPSFFRVIFHVLEHICGVFYSLRTNSGSFNRVFLQPGKEDKPFIQTSFSLWIN